jgi:hypothetical protein
MTVRVLTGSKHDIARAVSGIDGDVREAIVFIEEPAAAREASSPTAAAGAQVVLNTDHADAFAEMAPYTVAVEHFDDARRAIYARGDGE